MARRNNRKLDGLLSLAGGASVLAKLGRFEARRIAQGGKRRALRRQLRCESLETRQLLAADLGSFLPEEADGMVDLSRIVSLGAHSRSELESLIEQAENEHDTRHFGAADLFLDRDGLSTPSASVYGPLLNASHGLGAGNLETGEVSSPAGPLFAGMSGFAPIIPALSSNPGAQATLYLDFDGHTGASWATSGATTPPLDRDGDPNSLSVEELAFIEDVWRIVAEDYAPFNINVTTVQPAVLAEGVPSDQANGVALRLAIGGTSALLGLGDSIAGYGFYNSFTNSSTNIAYVFPEVADGSHRSALAIGMIASHEAGHSFGLRHQSGAYDISAKWQAIMNSSTFGFEDAWWITGTNDQGNLQDDMAVLANTLNGFGYRSDDVAGTIAGAKPLSGSGTNFTGNGLIGVGGDVDVWSFTAAVAFGAKVKVTGSEIGQNLDVVVDFLDASGNVILTADPANSTDAELVAEAAGTRYIVVRSTGEYGRVGQYTISVTESSPGINVNSLAELKTSELGTNDSFSVSLTSKPTSNVAIDVSSSDTTEGTLSPSQLVFTPTDWYLPHTVTVVGMDDAIVDGVVQYAIDFAPASSADANYNGIVIGSLAAANADDDVPGTVFQLEGTGYVYVKDMEVAADGSLFVIGSFSDTVDFDPGPGTTTATAAYLTNGFIAKYSASQELIWARTFGETTGLTTPNSLDLDSAGNPYIVGGTSSTTLHLGSIILTGQGSTDAFATKLDSDGNFIWARSWGSTASDQAYALFIDANDRLHIAGSFYGTVDFNPASGVTSKTSAGGADAYVAQFDSNGNFQSVASFGGIENDFVNELAGDAFGNIYAAGYFYGTSQFGVSTLTSAGSYDSFLIKLNSTGSVQWARQAAGVPAGSIEPKIAVMSTGDVYFSAHFTEAVDFGPGTRNLTSAGDSDVFLTKWSTDGSLLQAGHISGPDRIRIKGLALDAADQPVLFGYFGGTVDMDPTSQTVSRTSSGIQSDFILRLDADAQFLDFYQMPSDTVLARSLALDTRGNIYASGQIASTIAMPTGQQLVNGVGGYDSYILKLAIAPGVTLGSSVGLTTSEDGSSATFSVVLDTPPTSDVTIAITTSDATEGSVAPSSLTFTPSNWNVPQSVLVTGIDDSAIDGDQVYFVLLAPATSSDPKYAGLDANDVNVTNLDNDAPLVLFADSFEVGEWNGLWVEDSQNDWFRSNQRATSGSFAAEVDGSANNATLTTAYAIDLSGMQSATLTFDWLIESGFDAGEYLTLDISTNGGTSWTQDVRRLNGNVSVEDVWHSETVNLTPYKSVNLKVRFRSTVSASDEDANVDNVRIVGVADGPNTPPIAVLGGPTSMHEGSSVLLSGAGSSDPDGSIVSYAWDFNNDGQYNDASGVAVNFSTTVSGLHTVGLQVTDNRGATAATSVSVTVNNVVPTASAGSDVNGYVGTPVSLSAAGSSDPGNDIVSFAWDLDNDGQYDDATGASAVFNAVAAGTYIVRVLVTDADGASSTDSATITLSQPYTKFYVVDDGSPDRTYEYGATGSAIEDYAINSGNTQPRGAASNAAGNTIWVADKNRKVYVYNTSGGTLGSWSAGTLASTAVVEGIATNGTDVWIIDSKSDKVFRYTGAAGRTSGSQTAASNFSLNSSNSSPKGIVTDGTYLWVVNSSSSDKVFKYTLGGSLLGSWTIDSANKSPTGLTIDPTGASQSIWIVDSGTDKVYEYTNSLGKTSGSQSAVNIFALAAGNTNPQGIADPPAARLASSDQSPVIGLQLTDAIPANTFLNAFTNATQPSATETVDLWPSDDRSASELATDIFQRQLYAEYTLLSRPEHNDTLPFSQKGEAVDRVFDDFTEDDVLDGDLMAELASVLSMPQ